TEHRELPFVPERTVGLNVVRNEASWIGLTLSRRRGTSHPAGNVQCLLIRTESEAVRSGDSAFLRHRSLWINAKETTHREIDIAITGGCQIIDDAANTVHRIAVVHIGENFETFGLRVKLTHGGGQTSRYDKQGSLLIH